jgi:hypothetical protein
MGTGSLFPRRFGEKACLLCKFTHNLSKKWGLARFFPGSLGKKRACPRFFAAVGPHIIFIVYE